MKKAFFSLTVAESKKLIAKAVANLAEVKNALQDGKIIIARGTTNGFVASELLDKDIDAGKFSAGIVTSGRPCVTAEDERISEVVLVDGALSNEPWTEVIKGFKSKDVFIKGANCIDNKKRCGVLLGSRVGGTMGASMHILASVGAVIIVPVSLEKLVLSSVEASCDLGIDNLDYSLGMPCGMMLMPPHAIVVTELDALELLFYVRATHVASGGIDGSEGSLTFCITGEDSDVKKAFDYILSIKGEKPSKAYKTKCSDCKTLCYERR